MAVINGKTTGQVRELEPETVEQARERLAQERRAAEAFAERYGLEFVDMTTSASTTTSSAAFRSS